LDWTSWVPAAAHSRHRTPKIRAVIYHYEHRGVNRSNRSADFAASLQPDEPPEVVLKTAREVEIRTARATW